MIRCAFIFIALLFCGGTPALATPMEAMRHLIAADAAFAQHQPRSAWVELMNATDADSGNQLAWMYRARVALALDRPQEAEDALNRAIKAGFPENRTLHFRAQALLLQHNPEEALRIAAADRVSPLHRAYATRMRGRARAAMGDYPGAAREFGAAMNMVPRDPALWIDLANFRLLTGERRGAIEASDRAVALDRSNVAALVLKGKLARDQYGLAAALIWFDRALKIDRLDIDAQIERAATLGDMGRTREMLEATRAVQALDQGNPRAFYLQAVLAARARKFALADKLADLTGGLLDDLPGMMLLKGAVAYQRDMFGEAIDALAPLVRLQPGNIAARRLLAAAEWQTGDADSVIATLQQVSEDAPDNYALTLLGRAYEARDDRTTAAAYLDRAALDKDAPPADPATVEDLRWAAQQKGDAASRAALAHALLAAGDGTQALDLALAIQRENLGAAEAHMVAGDAWSALSRWPQAIDAYARAANLNFSEAIALRFVAALGHGGRPRDARRVLALFLDQHPMNVAARVVQADLLMTDGRFADAAAVLEGLRRRIGQRDVAISVNLAWCYFKTDRPDDALALAAEAYRLAPAYPRVSHSYGWILFKSGRNPAGALALLQQAAAQAPGWPLARAHLAEAEMVHGRPSVG